MPILFADRVFRLMYNLCVRTQQLANAHELTTHNTAATNNTSNMAVASVVYIMM